MPVLARHAQPARMMSLQLESEDDELLRLHSENNELRARVSELEDLASRTEGLCEVLDDGGGWSSSLQTRATWLLGLLVCQSCSSFILADNESLLQAHPTVIYFMTVRILIARPRAF